ncbi:hypothetical protein [Sorangium sp. So ce542]|uniref:hypothetical protein n=1 Tax=Sorangium sp. So ce542 TaxID=3133316 RepID=UPI003F61CCEE
MTTTHKRPSRFVLSTAQLLLPIAIAGLYAGPARAQEAPAAPWHEGVSEERKQRAQALFAEARELHRRVMLAEARAKYEEALAAWEQPELRLYLGRVLKLMGLPLLAHENLRLALRWGPGSLDAEKEQEARAMMRALVERELAAVEIRCDEPGAVVLMDGQRWFVGPGAERRMVMPGEHVITARKDGYSTVVKPILVFAGQEASGRVDLSADTVVSRPRWATWIPWATLGAGAALGIAGGALMWHADADHDEADRRLPGRLRSDVRSARSRRVRSQRPREPAGDRRRRRRRSGRDHRDGPALHEQAGGPPYRGRRRREDRAPARRVARWCDAVWPGRVLIPRSRNETAHPRTGGQPIPRGV